MAVKKQTPYFWLVFKILNSCKKLFSMQGFLHIIEKIHAIEMVVSIINNSFKRNETFLSEPYISFNIDQQP